MRLFDFSDLEFYIHDSFTDVYRLNAAQFDPWTWQQPTRVCRLQLSSENKMAEFISEALRNCTIGRLRVVTRRELVLNAIRAVASTITVADLQVFHMRHIIKSSTSFGK